MGPFFSLLEIYYKHSILFSRLPSAYVLYYAFQKASHGRHCEAQSCVNWIDSILDVSDDDTGTKGYVEVQTRHSGSWYHHGILRSFTYCTALYDIGCDSRWSCKHELYELRFSIELIFSIRTRGLHTYIYIRICIMSILKILAETRLFSRTTMTTQSMKYM
jgi:hypothetical protein